MSERLGTPIELGGIVLVPIEELRTASGEAWWWGSLRCVGFLVRDGSGERRIALP